LLGRGHGEAGIVLGQETLLAIGLGDRGENDGSFNRSRESASIAGATSTPMTTPEAPTVGRVISAASLVPVEISSTRHPGETSAAVITVGTKRRDHRPTQPS
jgi:hypothetical protein